MIVIGLLGALFLGYMGYGAGDQKELLHKQYPIEEVEYVCVENSIYDYCQEDGVYEPFDYAYQGSSENY